MGVVRPLFYPESSIEGPDLLHLPAKPRIIPRFASMVAPSGPLATANREPRQARKGATVVVTLCAEVWLLGVIAISPSSAPVISL